MSNSPNELPAEGNLRLSTTGVPKQPFVPSHDSGSEEQLLAALRSCCESPVAEDLGDSAQVTTLKSSIGAVKIMPQYMLTYPRSVVHALIELYAEYNSNFAALVDANRENPGDYKFAETAAGKIENSFVQIDMLGLPAQFLRLAEFSSPAEVKNALRHSVFEIENSLAMYQLLEGAFANEARQSAFGINFRSSLEAIRQRHGKPIALLAVTEEKLEGMRQMEFGKCCGEAISAAEVKELSGFDALMGPAEFRAHLAANQGQCQYLLYVRASDPIDKLKNPTRSVAHSLLDDTELRRIVKAHSITLNIDAPNMAPQCRINDTKAYMPTMGMGYRIASFEDLLADASRGGVARQRFEQGLGVELLTTEFAHFLSAHEVDPLQVLSGEVQLRAKPLQGTYGCYGHVRGGLLESSFRSEVERNMRQRGEYIIQPEMRTPMITNKRDGSTYTYIDRNFLSCVDGKICFVGGVRNLLPVDSHEAKHGRLHGSKSSVYAEIRGEN
jgi:hypothetical protein